MTERDDVILYEHILQKDRTALEAMYDRYEKILFSFAFRMTRNEKLAEEVLQDVFIKLWHDTGTYDRTKGKFSSWIMTMTRNKAIDLLRKEKKQATVELMDNDALQVSGEKTVEDTALWNEKRSEILEAVSKLKKDQRDIVELFYFKGLSQQKIAEQCDLPLGTVKGRIRLALKHLRSLVSTEGGSGHGF